jgi:hypothetical protein
MNSLSACILTNKKIINQNVNRFIFVKYFLREKSKPTGKTAPSEF